MKKLGFILIACALMLGLSQCKKNDETNKPENGGNSVCITLSVGGDTRANVIPGDEIAPVYYAVGDMIHVVSDGKYIGTLTYNGSHFTGDITNPTEGQPLHFYFLGNVTPSESLVAGETSTCSVVISDQTASHPVISYAPSNQSYSVGATHYTATLLNKCALVKFNVTTVSENATCITGMRNKVTVDFETNEFDYSQEGNGIITLSAGEGEKWVILLPQDEVSQSEAHSADGFYTGTCASIPVVAENDYQVNGIVVDISHPIGAINGLFTVNANGDQVFFSQGNLQYIGSASTPYWKFAEHQWDYLGDNGQGGYSYYVDRDLFGWGTSGYNHGAVCYQPWSTSSSYSSNYNAYGNPNYNLYDQTGQADWGFNAILNGGNQENLGWRSLLGTIGGEWEYILNNRTTFSGIRYAKAKVNEVNGLVLLPDNWNSSTYALNNTNNRSSSYSSNIITALDWNGILQTNGAVFLPAGGSRKVISLNVLGSYGCYWTASNANYDVMSGIACYMSFYDGFIEPGNVIQYRDLGCSVRLVYDYHNK